MSNILLRVCPFLPSEISNHNSFLLDFFNPFWAKAVLVVGASLTAMNLAEPRSEDALVTRWIKSMTTPSEYWAVQNNAHTQLSINMAQVEIEKAVAPPTMRPYRSVQ
jgi:hypothetical protein